jgi:type IV pilus assembly protein PilY1
MPQGAIMKMQPVKSTVQALIAIGALLPIVGNGAIPIPNAPLTTVTNAKPLVMLTVGKDHRLFYEAYNDSSDIDGDGSIDVGFKFNNPNIIYYGLFDPKLCYTHSGSGTNGDLFAPSSIAGANGTCPGKWSGLWLNYMTTSRIDALRRVFYGGYREVDTNTDTILRRAYIPGDAHSWAKEYTSEAVDGYKISDYTPLTQPAAGKRIFFGTLTDNSGTNCSTLNNCSDMPPLLRVRENVGDGKRVWEWASKERPVLQNSLSSGGFPADTGAQKDFTIRVQVCTPAFNDGCKQYPNGTYKPTGLLHDYGENDAMLFGLLTGSYDNHMSGGRLRKVVSAFSTEVNSNTGQFTAAATIVNTLNKLRIRGFNQSSSSSEYWKGNPYGDSAKAPTEGQLMDWGNPIGEMMYEVTRYFAGKNSSTAAYNDKGTVFDSAVGLSTATWNDPYTTASYCSRAANLVVSDIYPSFDSDQLPGSSFNAFASDISGLNSTTEANFISGKEGGINGGNFFIGQSNALYDSAPTSKTVAGLGTIRGLAPNEPSKQGSYYSAAMASFAKRNDLRSDKASTQTIDTFVVALSASLPKISAKLPNGKVITFVPFGKTTGGSGVSATKGDYQPTDQIVDFYVERIANSGPADTDLLLNGGRYYARFIINYEDVEQGGDHDMDAVAVYEVVANANNTLTINVIPTYQAGGMRQNMGYVISGTSKDGVYLVAQDENVNNPYFLNVPPTRAPGYCDTGLLPTPADCNTLPTIGGMSSITFTPSSTPAATLLKDPLWYAAKWGSFKDSNGDNLPDIPAEWDSNGDGVPDNYFLVQNPSKLPAQLKQAFDNIAALGASSSSVVANGGSLTANSLIYRATFETTNWSGELKAYPLSSSSGLSATEAWAASSKVPSEGARKLFVRTPSGSTQNFTWSALSSADQGVLGNADILNYTRGSHSKEIANGGGLRNRAGTVLGDMVDSSPVYVADSNTVFIGSNDGMLHAFKGSDGSVAGSGGTELFGFIPAESVSRLKNRTQPAYTHEYFVDGAITVTPKTATTGNKNYLFALLGRGGKGLFSLDVTNPSSFATSDFLWEYTPTGSTDALADIDLGYMLGRATFVKLNDGKNALIAGNGYNSISGKAVLYIFTLDNSGQIASVKKLDTTIGSDNGLATPTGFDADKNGTVDFIYAGDLKGNLWKFDVSAATPASWNVAFTGTPLFVAKDSASTRQPITSPVTVSINDVPGDVNLGKRFVFFGTGSYFRTGDPSDVSSQTWYALIDENATILNRSNLKERAISQNGLSGTKKVRSFTSGVVGDMAGKKGWYLDWPNGERITSTSSIVKLVVPTLTVNSIIPDNSDLCKPGGSGYTNFIAPYTGTALPQVVDVNKDGNFANDKIGTEYIGSVNNNIGLLGGEGVIVSGNGKTKIVVGGSEGTTDMDLNGLTPIKGRISWRELWKD